MRRVLAVLLALLAPAPALAWNAKGHRVIASIAYRRLDEPTRGKLADILKRHPAYAEWMTRDEKGVDETLTLLWNASVFPDDARRAPWTRYNRPRAHYVNFRVLAEEGDRIDPPLPGENVINSYVAHLRRIEEPRTSAEDRALHLSWVLHQAGDIHQPLHAVARFSRALPEGDRGGNGVQFPGRNGPSNLHAYWDGLLGDDASPETVERLADELIGEYPAEGMAAELAVMDIGKWAEESARLAVDVAYRDLGPNITSFADKPVGYEADATRAARRRAATAGFRLGQELQRLVAER
jgi:hypothetical protein